MSRLVTSCLISVVSGEVYERYAKDLRNSARNFFPGVAVSLEGRSGWPDATLYRYHAILENEKRFSYYDYLYLCDADMRFETHVGDEIYAPLVAVQHPGYFRLQRNLPYENRYESAAFIRGARGTYYAGGFVGGERDAFLDLARRIAEQIDADDEKGIVARWHDESHLNKQLALYPPTVTLPPSYCYPDDASAYPWLKPFPRILVALDKTPAERGER